VAIALSYRATPSAGLNPARRRGRIYIGPLVTTASSGVPARPNAGSRAVFVERFVNLRTSLLAVGYELGVYSSTDNAFHGIDQVWCDDAFDTMRSRGVRATGRTYTTL
jgi:hypothetical protein